LVHVNKTSSAPVAILSAKRAAVPCVWHVRSFAKNLGLVARYFVGACSRLLFVSKAARKPYESAFPQFSKKFEVLYNRVNLKVALDEKDILKKELGLSHETPLVGMIAHFVSWKKHDDFLKCASEIMKVMPQVRFVIAGGTLDSNPQEEKAKNDYKLKLASIFNQYQLSGRVFFLGQRYDVNNIFPDLDTLVIPSQFETFGRVAVEAACFGVPLVAYRGGGLPEIFLDQQEIIFVNPADIQALAEGVLSLLKSPQKKETQIKKAREKALKFTSDESVRSLEKIYRELLGASS
jgi:glycosyltransferase involved in cell wall biosynthesis